MTKLFSGLHESEFYIRCTTHGNIDQYRKYIQNTRSEPSINKQYCCTSQTQKGPPNTLTNKIIPTINIYSVLVHYSNALYQMTLRFLRRFVFKYDIPYHMKEAPTPFAYEIFRCIPKSMKRISDENRKILDADKFRRHWGDFFSFLFFILLEGLIIVRFMNFIQFSNLMPELFNFYVLVLNLVYF